MQPYSEKVHFEKNGFVRLLKKICKKFWLDQFQNPTFLTNWHHYKHSQNAFWRWKDWTSSTKTSSFKIRGLVHIISNKETPGDKNWQIMLVFCDVRDMYTTTANDDQRIVAFLGFSTARVFGWNMNKIWTRPGTGRKTTIIFQFRRQLQGG